MLPEHASLADSFILDVFSYSAGSFDRFLALLQGAVRDAVAIEQYARADAPHFNNYCLIHHHLRLNYINVDDFRYLLIIWLD